MPRQCFFISGLEDEHGFIPSLVTEGEPGHAPLVGTGEHAAPWYWGRTRQEAERHCDEQNERLGLTRDDVVEIILSSMAASRG